MLKIIFLEIFWFESGKVGKTLTNGSIKPFFVDKSSKKNGQKPTFFGQKMTTTKITLKNPKQKWAKPKNFPKKWAEISSNFATI